MEKHLEKMINSCDGWWMVGDSHGHYYLYECLTQIRHLKAFSFQNHVFHSIFETRVCSKNIFFSNGGEKMGLTFLQKQKLNTTHKNNDYIYMTSLVNNLQSNCKEY